MHHSVARFTSLTFATIASVATPASAAAARELPPPGISVCEEPACARTSPLWRLRVELLPGFRRATGDSNVVYTPAFGSTHVPNDGSTQRTLGRFRLEAARIKPVSARDNLLRLQF